MIRAFINARIYDYNNYIENGYIIFDDKIIEVGEMANFNQKGIIATDAHGALILPNFVCSHSHIYSIFARGLSLPFAPKNFQDILDQMWWKMDSKINNEITYYSGIVAGFEFSKNGITTIIDHHASGKEIRGSLNALKSSLVDILSLRTSLCFETSDRFDINECIDENTCFIEENNSSTCKGLFGLHASMSLSDETLIKVKEKIKDSPIHIHVAESKLDVDDCLAKYGTTIIKRLDGFNLINPNSLIVHGIYLTDEELEIIAKRNAYLVVNTSSNMNNGVGLPDIKRFLKYGVKVMIGNDGLSTTMANEYLNAFYTTRLLNNDPLGMSLGDILTMINNSFEYCSNLFNIKLGRIKKGYEADFSILNYVPFTPMNKDNVFGHIFFGLYPNYNPREVYRGGQCIFKNGKSLTTKAERDYAKALEISSSLWNELKEN